MSRENEYKPERPFQIGDTVATVSRHGRTYGPYKVTKLNALIEIQDNDCVHYGLDGYEFSAPRGAHIEHWTPALAAAAELGDMRDEIAGVTSVCARPYWFTAYLTREECDVLVPILRRVRDEHGDEAKRSGDWS